MRPVPEAAHPVCDQLSAGFRRRHPVRNSRASPAVPASPCSGPKWLQRGFGPDESWIRPRDLPGFRGSELEKILPDVVLAGDIIVGFCGETEADYEATRTLLQEVRFKNNFIFKYSLGRAPMPLVGLKMMSRNWKRDAATTTFWPCRPRSARKFTPNGLGEKSPSFFGKTDREGPKIWFWSGKWGSRTCEFKANHHLLAFNSVGGPRET